MGLWSVKNQNNSGHASGINYVPVFVLPPAQGGRPVRMKKASHRVRPILSETKQGSLNSLLPVVGNSRRYLGRFPLDSMRSHLPHRGAYSFSRWFGGAERPIYTPSRRAESTCRAQFFLFCGPKCRSACLAKLNCPSAAHPILALGRENLPREGAIDGSSTAETPDNRGRDASLTPNPLVLRSSPGVVRGYAGLLAWRAGQTKTDRRATRWAQPRTKAPGEK
jgi:hypothetical protein